MTSATPAPLAPPSAGPARGGWLGLFFVLLATAAVYVRALQGELVYDDLLMIARNPLLTDFAHLPTVFKQAYWDFLEPQEAAHIGYWRPLTATVLLFAHELGGGSVVVFHAACLLVHLGATALAFALARRLAGSVSVGLVTAAIFGLHPVHVESVAWITALNDPLFGLFGLASLLAYLRWRDGGSRGLPVVAALCFVPALLAKELGAGVLPMLVALDLGRRSSADEPERVTPLAGLRRPWAAYGPFVLVLLAYVGARMAVFESAFAGFDRTTTNFGVSFQRLLLLRLEIFGGALALLSWPLELNLFRPFHPTIALSELAPALIATLAAVGLLVVLWKRRARPALAGLLFLPAGILPVLVSVDSLGRFPLSERFLYLPVFGFGLLVALALRRISPGRGGLVAGLVLCALYAGKSFERTAVWQNELALFEASAKAAPRSVYVRWGLGRVLLQAYNRTEDPALLERAFQVYEQAQDLLVESREPESDIFVTSRDFLQVNLGYGWCHLLEARASGFRGSNVAIEIFEELELRVGEARMERAAAEKLGITVLADHLELELVYAALGAAYHEAHRDDEAIAAYQKALTLRPNLPETHLGLGRLYSDLGDWTLAELHFRRALREQPENYENRVMLAQTLFAAGRIPAACELAESLADENKTAEPCTILAAAALQRSDASGALRWLDRALALEPLHGYAWYLRARALTLADARQEALVAYRRATELMPQNFEAHYNFGAYLVASGAQEAAMQHLLEAYALCRMDQPLAQLRQFLAGLPFEDADIPYRLGVIDRGRGLHDLAESWWDGALTIDPDHADSLFAKGALLRQRGRNEEALALLRRAVALRPRSFLMNFELGEVLGELGARAEAAEILRKTLELDPPLGWDEELKKTAKRDVRKLLEAQLQ